MLFASESSDDKKWLAELREQERYEQSLQMELKGTYTKGTWLNKDNNWYYFGDLGKLERGWFHTYAYHDQDGNLIKDNNTYFADDLGRMQTGWIQDPVDNKWYYLTGGGALLKNGTTPDGYQVDEMGAMIENNGSTSERKNSIEVFGVWCSTDSAGGVSPRVSWRNGTGKAIKYITFDLVPYNAVGDKQSCQIRGYSEFSGYVTGPIEPENEVGKYIASNRSTFGQVLTDGLGRPYRITQNYENVSYTQEEINRTFSQKSVWDCAWYNQSINEIRMTGITVEFMDGSTQTVDPAEAYYWK